MSIFSTEIAREPSDFPAPIAAALESGDLYLFDGASTAKQDVFLFKDAQERYEARLAHKEFWQRPPKG